MEVNCNILVTFVRIWNFFQNKKFIYKKTRFTIALDILSNTNPQSLIWNAKALKTDHFFHNSFGFKAPPALSWGSSQPLCTPLLWLFTNVPSFPLHCLMLGGSCAGLWARSWEEKQVGRALPSGGRVQQSKHPSYRWIMDRQNPSQAWGQGAKVREQRWLLGEVIHISKWKQKIDEEKTLHGRTMWENAWRLECTQPVWENQLNQSDGRDNGGWRADKARPWKRAF